MEILKHVSIDCFYLCQLLEILIRKKNLLQFLNYLRIVKIDKVKQDNTFKFI